MMVLRILLWLLAVLGGLLGLVVLLLCVPVHFLAEYGPQTRLRLRYGFVTVTLLPGKEKPGKEKPKKKPAESKPKTPLKVRLAELGIPERLPETMDELLHMLTELVRLADGLRRSLTLHRLRLDVPQVTELCCRLAEAGVDIPTDIINEEECAAALYELLK